MNKYILLGLSVSSILSAIFINPLGNKFKSLDNGLHEVAGAS